MRTMPEHKKCRTNHAIQTHFTWQNDVYSENHGRAPLPLSSPSEPLYMAPGDPVFYTNSGAQENYAPLSEMTMLEGKALSLVLLIGPLSKVCVGVLSLKSPLL